MASFFWAAWGVTILIYAWYFYYFRAPSILQIEAYVLSRASDVRVCHDAVYYKIIGEWVLVPRETEFLKADVHLRLVTAKMLAKVECVSMYKMRRIIWQHAKENGL